MQFYKFLVLAVATALPAAEACKCLGPKGHNNVKHTRSCCNGLNGSFSHKDCAASSISEHLREFRACCEARGSKTSDCDFPGA
ncbi:hypothetical protein AURDEDRAFT_68112 [Auricularia subglabra TFB-10046 SS5]|nr:hypothetical protein AURDEDRAFT_68112 [Auricularia subglabra TFB-10046 SS5]